MRQSLAIGLFAVLAVAGPAQAEVTPAGACTAAATWRSSGVTKTIATSEVIEIPRADEVSWKAAVHGPVAGGLREVAGQVTLDLPWPLGGIGLARWSGPAEEVEKAGTYRYDLPSVVPAGVVLDLTASHDEKGSRHCTAHVGVLVPGGPFDSPLIWAVLAGLVIFGAALFLLGRPPGAAGMGRLIAGTLVGFLFGLFLGLTTVLFGLIPLASPVVTVLILLGVVAGVVWVRSGVAAKPA